MTSRGVSEKRLLRGRALPRSSTLIRNWWVCLKLIARLFSRFCRYAYSTSTLPWSIILPLTMNRSSGLTAMILWSDYLTSHIRPTLSYQRLQNTQPLTDEELYDKIRRTVPNKQDLQVLESFLVFNKYVCHLFRDIGLVDCHGPQARSEDKLLSTNQSRSFIPPCTRFLAGSRIPNEAIRHVLRYWE